MYPQPGEKIHPSGGAFGWDAENETWRALAVDENGRQETHTALRWDTKSTDSAIIYLGEAEVGTSDSSDKWRIAEINTTNGTIKYAAAGHLTQVWNDREGLTYA